jgi:hypothetical protein
MGREQAQPAIAPDAEKRGAGEFLVGPATVLRFPEDEHNSIWNITNIPHILRMKFCARGRILKRNGAFRFWKIQSGWRLKKGTDTDSGGTSKSLEAEL